MNTKQKFITALIILIAGVVFQLRLQSHMRQYAIDGFYFQVWSSETLMQTVSIEDLRDAPIETLLHIHIQPPGLDLIRAIIVHILPKPNEEMSLVQHVDYWLYKTWIFLYGVLGAIIFLWIFEITNAKLLSLVLTLVFLLHPASILYATVLDSTFLTSVLVLIFYYLLWMTKSKHLFTASHFVIILLALFFIRPIFQLPFILISVISLLMVGVSKRSALLVLLIVGGIAGLYMAKQYYQFGTFSTSSFAGLNLNRSIGKNVIEEYKNYLETIDEAKEEGSFLPQTLARKYKLTGRPNYNNIKYLQLNSDLEAEYKEYIFSAPSLQLLISYRENIQSYFAPSSALPQNEIVNRLPWRYIYERLFSAPILYILIILFGASWLFEKIKLRDYLPSVGIVLPGIFIFAVCVLFEKGENSRFKYFLEPVLFVFLASQFYFFCRKFITKFIAKDEATAFFGK